MYKPTFPVHSAAVSPPYSFKSLDTAEESCYRLLVADSRAAAQLAAMDQAKARTIFPRRALPSPEEVDRKLRAALEKKKWAVTVLADAQKEVEMCRSEMIEVSGLAATKSLCEALSDFGDSNTAMGAFMAAVSKINFKPYTVSYQLVA